MPKHHNEREGLLSLQTPARPTLVKPRYFKTTLLLLTLLASPVTSTRNNPRISLDNNDDNAPQSIDLIKLITEKMAQDKPAVSTAQVHTLLSSIKSLFSLRIAKSNRPTTSDLNLLFQAAISYLQGKEVKKDLHFAKQLLLYGAERNDMHAQYQLGILLMEEGANQTQDGLLWLAEAATNGHVDAQAELGSYLMGTVFSLPDDEKTAKTEGLGWLRYAAKANHPKALLLLGKYHENGTHLPKNLKKAAQLYHAAMTNSDGATHAHATYLYANMLANGSGVTKNKSEAAELLYSSCDMPCEAQASDLLVQLAKEMIQPNEVSKIGERATKFLLRAVETGNMEAMKLIYEDILESRDQLERQRLAKMSVKQADDHLKLREITFANSLVKLGDTLQNATHKDNNVQQELIKLSYERARGLGHTQAEKHLFIYHIRILTEGENTSLPLLAVIQSIASQNLKKVYARLVGVLLAANINTKTATELQKALNHGDFYTVSDLAYTLAQTHPVFASISAAVINMGYRPITVLETKAAQGDPIATHDLGTRFQDDQRYLYPNHQRAKALLTQAAEHGYAEAQYHLSLFLSTSPSELPMARYWLERASNHGHVRAKHQLARMDTYKDYRKPDNYFAEMEFAIGKKYLEGDGVPKNTSLSSQWMQEAYAHGYQHEPSRDNTTNYDFYSWIMISMAATLGLLLFYFFKNHEQKQQKEKSTRARELTFMSLKILTNGLVCSAQWQADENQFKLNYNFGSEIKPDQSPPRVFKTNLPLPPPSAVKPPEFFLSHGQLCSILTACITDNMRKQGLQFELTHENTLIMTLPASSTLSAEECNLANINIKNSISYAFNKSKAVENYLIAIINYHQKHAQVMFNNLKSSLLNEVNTYEKRFAQKQNECNAHIVTVSDYLKSHGPVGKKANELNDSCKRFATIVTPTTYRKQIHAVMINTTDTLEQIQTKIAQLKGLAISNAIAQNIASMNTLSIAWDDLSEKFVNAKKHERNGKSSLTDTHDSAASNAKVSTSESAPAKTERMTTSKNKQVKSSKSAASTSVSPSPTSTQATPTTVTARAAFFTQDEQPLVVYRKTNEATASETSMQPRFNMGALAASLWNMVQHIAMNIRHAGNVLADPESIAEEQAVAIREIVDSLPMLYEYLQQCCQDSDLAKVINLAQLETIRHAIRHKMHCFLYAGDKDINRRLLIDFCVRIQNCLIDPFNDKRAATYLTSYFSHQLDNLYQASTDLLKNHAKSQLEPEQIQFAIRHELCFIASVAKLIKSNYVYRPTQKRPEQQTAEMQRDHFYRAICGAADAIGEFSPHAKPYWLIKLLDHSHKDPIARIKYMQSIFATMNTEDFFALCREIRNLRGHEVDMELSALIATNQAAYLDHFDPDFIDTFAVWVETNLKFLTNENMVKCAHELSLRR